MQKITISTKKPMVVGTDICDRPIRQGDYLLCVDPPSYVFSSDTLKDGKIYRAGADAGYGTIIVRTEGNRRVRNFYSGHRFVTLGQ